MDITTYTIGAEIKNEIKIIQISDLHAKPYEKVLYEIKKLNADIAAVTGDLIDGRHPAELKSAFGFLQECAHILPTFYSLGNHEREMREDALFKLRRTGARILNNKFEMCSGIIIGGLNSGYFGCTAKRMRLTPPPDISWIDRFSAEKGFKVLLCHHPEYYEPYLKDKDINLVLSGHAHGGQWRLFGRGIFAPGQGFMPKYTSGLHEGRLIISRGLANTAKPVPRLFNRRELVLIRLVPR